MRLEEMESKLQNLKRLRSDFYIANCPVHDDVSASLGVNIRPSGDVFFYCFAGCSHEAVCDRLQVSTKVDSPPKIRKKFIPHKACRWLEENWSKFSLSDEHKDYLIGRGINYKLFNLISANTLEENFPESNMCEEFGFTHQGTTVSTLRENRIVIPYFRNGRIRTIRSRAFAGGVKYLNMPGWPGTIFTSDLHSRRVIVTEGEFKAMACIQNGFDACAVPGIMSCHEEVISFCKGRDSLVWFDSQVSHTARIAAAKLARKIDGRVFEITPTELFFGYSKMDIDEAVNLVGAGVLALALGASF